VNDAEMHVTPPGINSISGLQEDVSWTPYLYEWDAASQAWVYVVGGSTFAQTAFSGSANSTLFTFGYGTEQQTFYILQAGYFRVADYVVWNQYNSTYDFEWAGTHIFDDSSGFGGSVYDNWCYFPPAGASPNTPRPAPPPANAPLPTPPHQA
jgi:hypothetical protein